VEHPCNRCGAAVDNNSPFCPACEAPQIRFVPREDVEDAVRLHPATVPPAQVVVSAPGTDSYNTAAASERKRWLRAAIYAGAIGFILSFLPTGPILALPVAGWLAVSFYTRMARVQLRPREGFRIGAVAGLAAFVMILVVGMVAMMAPGAKSQFHQALLGVAGYPQGGRNRHCANRQGSASCRRIRLSGTHRDARGTDRLTCCDDACCDARSSSRW